jgi:hypothetical protein
MKHPTQELMRHVLRPGQELHPLIPPLWTTEYDWDGLDNDAFNNWHIVLSPIPPSDAERRNLSDLIRAWESGLDTVTVLPRGRTRLRVEQIPRKVMTWTSGAPA